MSPDFNVKRQCRNFDEILAWKEAHEIIVTDEEERFRVPEAIKELPAEGLAIPLDPNLTPKWY